jgi:SAM-dependent methyltransferase
VLEHLDDDARALRELRRTLRPGGVAVITVPAYEWLFSSHDEALDHRRRYGKRQLLRRVREADLVPERVTHYNTLLFPLIAPVRLATRNRPASEDAKPTWAPVNAVLYRLFTSERALMDRRSLPFGLSLAVVARRPA